MTVAKILGAFLLTLILGMSFGAINTAEGAPGRRTLKCPGPAHWRLPSHVAPDFQKSGSSCIKKGTKKGYGVGAYRFCKAKEKCGSNIDCAYREGWLANEGGGYINTGVIKQPSGRYVHGVTCK
jgi:hypothetical protein